MKAGTPETPETPEWIPGACPELDSRNSSISLDTGVSGVPPNLDPEPPVRGHVRIALSQAASDALLAAGDAFLIVGRGSYPDAPGRMVIHCLPVPKPQADAACRVAMGEARAVKIKPKSPTTAEP